MRDHGSPHAIPVAGKHSRIAECNRTCGDSISGSSGTRPDPRPLFRYRARTQSRAEPNSKTDRAEAHPNDPERDKVGCFRPKGCSGTFGIAPWNSLFPFEEAWNLPSRDGTP